MGGSAVGWADGLEGRLAGGFGWANGHVVGMNDCPTTTKCIPLNRISN